MVVVQNDFLWGEKTTPWKGEEQEVRGLICETQFYLSLFLKLNVQLQINNSYNINQL